MIRITNNTIRRFTDSFRHLLFVPKCAACKERVDIGEYRIYAPFCRECSEKWEKEISRPCPNCGRKTGDCICGIFADRSHAIDSDIHLSAYNDYGGVTRLLLIYAKNHNIREVYDFLIERLFSLIEDKITVKDETVLTYIPRKQKRIRTIGHDQCAILARGISEKTGVPLLKLIMRKRKGKVHHTLDTRERIKNARKTYYLNGENKKYIRGREVILLDDIVTTGAAAARCAYLLKRAGASKVYLVSAAKNYLKDQR